MKKSVLILCTGNSCRSQMAEGFLRSFDSSLDVFSAGTKPAESVHPFAVKVMLEEWIDISLYKPKSVDEFLQRPFDYLITVCDAAKSPAHSLLVLWSIGCISGLTILLKPGKHRKRCLQFSDGFVTKSISDSDSFITII